MSNTQNQLTQENYSRINRQHHAKRFPALKQSPTTGIPSEDPLTILRHNGDYPWTENLTTKQTDPYGSSSNRSSAELRTSNTV